MYKKNTIYKPSYTTFLEEVGGKEEYNKQKAKISI